MRVRGWEIAKREATGIILDKRSLRFWVQTLAGEGLRSPVKYGASDVETGGNLSPPT